MRKRTARGARNRPKLTRAKRDWTILVYLAADNDLSSQPLADPIARERFITASDAAWRSRDTPDYVDVVDLCERVRRSPGIGTAATAVIAAARRVIFYSRYRSRAPERPRGLSVYLPRDDFQRTYDRLRFARDTRWRALARAVASEGDP